MEPITSGCSKVSVKRRALAVAIRSSGMPARTKVAPNVSSGEKPGVHLLLVGSKTDFSGNRFIYCRIYYKRLPKPVRRGASRHHHDFPELFLILQMLVRRADFA